MLPVKPRGANALATARRNRVRDAEIRAAYASGQYTMSTIAKRYRLTDSRVWQIVHSYGRTQPLGENDA
jgi:Mor family transcriptional regulator